MRFSILGNSGGVVNNLAGGVKKSDRTGATIQCGIVNFQPIYSKMRSMVEVFRMMGDTRNIIPLTSMVTSCTIMEVWQRPPGVRTIIGGFIFSNVMLHDNANASDMNECVAPESNKIVAGAELMRRVP